MYTFSMDSNACSHKMWETDQWFVQNEKCVGLNLLY